MLLYPKDEINSLHILGYTSLCCQLSQATLVTIVWSHILQNSIQNPGVSVIFSLKLHPSQPVVVQLCQHTHLPGNLIPYLAANKLYDVAVGRRPVDAR
jgi:hypothetical protein